MCKKHIVIAAMGAVLSLTACLGGVGSYEPVSRDIPESDNGPTTTEPEQPPGQAVTPVTCRELQGDLRSGEHRPGQPCLNCHNPQDDEAPSFTLAGTLYTDLAGAAPVAGASIHLVDTLGNEILLTSARNGNFWTNQQITFPIVAHASLCPDVQTMVTPVTAADANCNMGNCHATDFRIRIP